MSKLPYEEKVSPAFIEKVKQVCLKLSIKPEWLMVCMAIETSKTFSSRIKNFYTNAVGLIQFMPSTAIWLDTTTYELEHMNEVDQLDYVYRYMKDYAGRMKSFEDVYLTIFYPAAVGKPDDYRFGIDKDQQKKIAIQNPCYDANHDMVVEKWEVKEAIMKFVPSGFEV